MAHTLRHIPFDNLQEGRKYILFAMKGDVLINVIPMSLHFTMGDIFSGEIGIDETKFMLTKEVYDEICEDHNAFTIDGIDILDGASDETKFYCELGSDHGEAIIEYATAHGVIIPPDDTLDDE